MEGMWSTALVQGVPSIEVTARLGEPITYVASVGAGPVGTPAMPPVAKARRQRRPSAGAAVKEFKKAGLKVAGIEFKPDGSLTIFTVTRPDQPLPLDTWLAQRAHKS
jgi:hypothetical protein